MTQPYTATTANTTWRVSLAQRVAELIDADRALKAQPGTTETAEFHAACQRLRDAQAALPFWVRWLFT